MAKKPARKARAVATDETGALEVEVVTEEAPAKPPAGIETWLIFITFAALLAAFLMVNMKMRSDYGEGWPF